MSTLNGKMAEMTLQELAEKSGGKYDTIWRKAKREFPGTSWTADTEVPPEIARVLVPSKSGKGRRKKQFTKPSPPAPKGQEYGASAPARITWPKAAQIRTALFNTLSVGVVVGHGALIWVECSELWETVGFFGGLVVFMVVLLAVLLASDPSKNRTSYYALWFMFCVDTAAYWVHYPSFVNYSVGDSVRTGVCIFICACSFMALLLFRDSKLD